MSATPIDTLVVNTIKGLAMDAVQAANSGHPGMPMGMAQPAWVLWHYFLKHDPQTPGWADRDRFVLSAGHGSMLLYSLLHLTGYDLPLDELRRFRQWGSRTPGHPEVGHTPGVETTTGPLGQGFANGVGMAIAERILRERFGTDLCDHNIYAIVSDGDLMEGITNEAASLAGHLRLGKLVYLYDDNRITIDGSTDLAFTENVGARFEALGWHVERVDGYDDEGLRRAIETARADERPSLICCRTVIGQGSPSKQGSEESHGAPLGVAEVRLTKQGLGMDPDASFVVPDEAIAHARALNQQRTALRQAWEARLAASPLREEWERWMGTPDLSTVAWPSWAVGAKAIATRKAGHAALNAAGKALPNLFGGSADLAGSNGSNLDGAGSLGPQSFLGRNMHFGVREHAMASLCNGMTLHGGVLPYCATFLVFHDYMRPAVRLSALMQQPVVYIYTHDSIYLGEDGPTHQPIEHLMAMRLIPNLVTLRPADANEVVDCWKVALSRRDGPTALVLTRQDLPILDRQGGDVAKGAYVLVDSADPQLTLIASGSEVSLALAAREVLAQEGLRVRVVNLCSWELFEAQDPAYRSAVNPRSVPRLAVEAGRTFGWERYADAAVGIDHYGASAPPKVLGEKFGFTVANVVAQARLLLG